MHKVTSLLEVADYESRYFLLKYDRMYMRVILYEYVYSATLYHLLMTRIRKRFDKAAWVKHFKKRVTQTKFQ